MLRKKLGKDAQPPKPTATNSATNPTINKNIKPVLTAKATPTINAAKIS